MRAVVVKEFGAPDVLQVQERPMPVLSQGGALVRVHATAINRADILQRMGMYPAPPGVVQDILGLEFSGVVEEVFASEHRHWIGKSVCGITAGGTYAEYVSVDVGALMEVPEGMSFSDAAAVPEAFITAHDALCTIAQCDAGKSVLVNGAASGVGLAAIQIATVLGAHPFATVRTEAKAERVRECGAVVLNNHSEFSDELKSHAPQGADIIVDLVGASVAEENLRALAQRGRWVLVGMLGGSRCEFDLALLLRKRARIEGTVLRGRSAHEKQLATTAFATFAAPHWATKALRPIVHAVLTLDEVKIAHEMMQANQNVGKIVLSVQGS